MAHYFIAETKIDKSHSSYLSTTKSDIEEVANGGTHFSINYYSFGQFSVNY